MSEVEIIVRGRDLAKAAFESTDANVKVVRKSADEMALSLRRAELAAQSAGAASERAMGAAAKASDKAAASAKEAAAAQENMARGIGSAEHAAKAEATAEADAAAATDKATKAALANERAQIAQASAASKVKVAQEEAAAASVKSSGAMAAGMEKLRSVGKAALEGLVVSSAAVGFEATKMAMHFDSAMTMLNTQANLPKAKIGELSRGILKLSGEVAQDPDSLAEALYHVESNFSSMGITSAKALEITKIAAEGATVGHAKLVDVTNALTAAVAANIPGVKNMSQAMGILNATVGSGDMQMQDLADAFGGGMVATVKGFGLSIKDVGAALATFGDNNVRGAQAGTALRMAVEAMAKPSQTAGDALKKLGMQQDTLAKDMQKGGLKLAINDLVERMHKAGVSAKQQGEVITELFGRKAGSGINTLVAQVDRLNSKYEELGKAGGKFGGAWAETTKTFQFQVTQLEDKVKALMITLGEKLIPILSAVMGWFNKHTTVLKVLAGIVGGVLLVAIAAYTASMISAAAATVAATWPILAVIAAVAGLVIGFKLLYDHSKAFRQFTQDLWTGIKAIWDQAKKHWDLIVVAIIGPLGLLVVYFRQHTDQLKKIWTEVWGALQKAWKSFQSGPLKDIEHGIDNVREWWKKNGAEIVADVKIAWKVISAEISVAMTIIISSVKVGWTLLVAWLRLIWGILRDAAKLVWDFLKDYITGAMHSIRNVITLVMDIIHGRWSKVWGDLKKLAVDTLKDAVKLIKDLVSNFGTLLWDAGVNLIKGLIGGIKSAFGGLKDTVSNLASQVRSFFPFSPAKEGPLSGEGSLDKAGVKMTSMLADGMSSGTAAVRAAASKVAEAARPHHRHHRRHGAHHRQPTINQQLTHLAHSEGHMSTHALDKAVEKLMGQHKLTVAQLTKTMQILMVKGGHKTSTKKIDDLIAEMKKQYKGLTSKEILDAAIKELEHHPHLSGGQLMSRVAKDLHAQARKKAGSSSGGGAGGDNAGYISDLTWQAGGVRYTVGGAGRSTGPGGTAAGGSSGSTSVGQGGSSGQHLTIAFAPMHVEVDLKDTSGHFSASELQGLRKLIRVKGGNVQKVLGS